MNSWVKFVQSFSELREVLVVSFTDSAWRKYLNLVHQIVRGEKASLDDLKLLDLNSQIFVSQKRSYLWFHASYTVLKVFIEVLNRRNFIKVCADLGALRGTHLSKPICSIGFKLFNFFQLYWRGCFFPWSLAFCNTLTLNARCLLKREFFIFFLFKFLFSHLTESVELTLHTSTLILVGIVIGNGSDVEIGIKVLNFLISNSFTIWSFSYRLWKIFALFFGWNMFLF